MILFNDYKNLRSKFIYKDFDDIDINFTKEDNIIINSNVDKTVDAVSLITPSGLDCTLLPSGATGNYGFMFQASALGGLPASDFPWIIRLIFSIGVEQKTVFLFNWTGGPMKVQGFIEEEIIKINASVPIIPGNQAGINVVIVGFGGPASIFAERNYV